MSCPIIEVKALSKRYRLGTIGATSLREEAERLWQQLKRRTAPGLHPSDSGASGGEFPRDLWALRDVSFEVQAGDVLGIIGRNGAGKSTLLKILSRITEPTSGEAILRGRAASLLEVGTGFHPELTGRENVYLNGAILGMKRHEIASRFDEIVAFAEMERHIDTPVKRYSSGQRVRLAFAVAAHLEAEILIVDEVLAVGDLAFQYHCIRKMNDLASSGRTVLVVSHQLSLIQSLCSRALLLEEGAVAAAGSPAEVTETFSASCRTTTGAFQPQTRSNPDYGIQLTVRNLMVGAPEEGGDLVIDLEFSAQQCLKNLGVGVRLLSESGDPVAALPDSLTHFFFPERSGIQCGRLVIPGIAHRLNGGTYRVDLWLSKVGSEYLIRIDPAGYFAVPASDDFGHGVARDATRFGYPKLAATWHCESAGASSRKGVLVPSCAQGESLAGPGCDGHPSKTRP